MLLQASNLLKKALAAAATTTTKTEVQKWVDIQCVRAWVKRSADPVCTWLLERIPALFRKKVNKQVRCCVIKSGRCTLPDRDVLKHPSLVTSILELHLSDYKPSIVGCSLGLFAVLYGGVDGKGGGTRRKGYYWLYYFVIQSKNIQNLANDH